MQVVNLPPKVTQYDKAICPNEYEVPYILINSKSKKNKAFFFKHIAEFIKSNCMYRLL